MVSHVGNMEGVEIVIDDILVHGKSLEEHTNRLTKVIEKARSIGLKLNSAKCIFINPEVDYVGHRLTGERLKSSEHRVKAILEMKDPEDRSELETVFGMLAYLRSSFPGLVNSQHLYESSRQENTGAGTVKPSKQLFTLKKHLPRRTSLLQVL